RNAEFRELRGRPDSRQHQQMRRADRAGGENDLAAAARLSRHAVLAPAHPGGALAGELKSFRQTTGFEPEIFPMQRRFEKAARRRPAPPALLIDVEIADALVVAGIEIVYRRNAVLDRGLAKSIEDIPAQARLLDPPFASGRVHALAQKMIDVFVEERPHVVPRPAGQPELPPLIVVGSLAEHVNHAVDGGRAADHFTTRIIEAATVEAGF